MCDKECLKTICSVFRNILTITWIYVLFPTFFLIKRIAFIHFNTIKNISLKSCVLFPTKTKIVELKKYTK